MSACAFIHWQAALWSRLSGCTLAVSSKQSTSSPLYFVSSSIVGLWGGRETQQNVQNTTTVQKIAMVKMIFYWLCAFSVNRTRSTAAGKSSMKTCTNTTLCTFSIFVQEHNALLLLTVSNRAQGYFRGKEGVIKTFYLSLATSLYRCQSEARKNLRATEHGATWDA